MSKLASQVSLTKSEIAFVDPGVSDLGTLLQHLRPEVDAIVLDSTRPAPAQMAEALRGRNGIAKLHVIAHGRPGELSFGGGAISLDNFDAHDRDFAEIGHAFGHDGALQLWSCNTGAGTSGSAFVQRLADATGAAVAAASHTIGAATLGGRWQLDTRSHAVDVTAPLTVEGIDSYPELLGPSPTPPGPGQIVVFTSTGSVVGNYSNIQLQSALDAATDAGDTVEIGAGTYSGQFTVSGLNGVTIEGVGAVTLQAPTTPLVATATDPALGGSIDGVLTIENSTGVTVEGLTVDGATEGANLAAGGNEVGIASVNSTGTVIGGVGTANAVTVENVRQPDADFGDQTGFGIYAVNSVADEANTVTIQNATVQNFQKDGILVENANATVENNTIIGTVNNIIAQNGIEIGATSPTFGIGTGTVTGTVSGNKVTNIGLTHDYGDEGDSGSGILEYNGTNLSITNNTVTLSNATTLREPGFSVSVGGAFDDGIDALNFGEAQNNVSVTGNTVTGAGSTLDAGDPGHGIDVQDETGGSGSVSGNTVNGFDIGVEIDPDNNGVGGAPLTNTAAPTATTNSFGSNIAGKFFQGDGITPFSPSPKTVVADSTLSGVGPGEIIVTDALGNVVVDTVFSSIQAAINAASSGDTIVIGAGTYDENVDVSKSLTIENVAGAAVTIVGQGGAIGALTIDTGVSSVTLKSSDGVASNFVVEGASAGQEAALYLQDMNGGIKVNGITVQAAATNGQYAVLSGDEQSNILFQNSVFTGTASSQLVDIQGSQAFGDQNGSVNFNGNTFSGSTNGSLLDMTAPGEVINNTFSGASQTAVTLNQSGVNVSGNTFSPLTPTVTPLPTTAYFIGDGSYDPQTIEKNNSFPQNDDIYVIQNGVRQDGVYTSIQAAISAAVPGDTVFVGNGTYNQNVAIADGVNIEGESQAGVIINGTLTTPASFDNTTVSNMTVNGTLLLDMTGTSEVNDSVFQNITFNLTGSYAGGNAPIGNGQVSGSIAINDSNNDKAGLTFSGVTMNSENNAITSPTQTLVYTLFHTNGDAQLVLNGVSLNGTASGTSSGLGAQWNMSPNPGETAAVTIEHSSTSGGGNFYVSGMSLANIESNIFDGQGLALNGVSNATVIGNTFENIDGTYVSNTGGQHRGLVIENTWGTPDDSNITVTGNTFQNITATDGAVAFQRYTADSPNGPATIDQLNNVDIEGNTFTSVNTPIYLNPTYFGAGAVLPASVNDSQLILGTSGNDSFTAPATGNADIFGGGGVDTVTDTGVTTADFSVVNGLWTVTNGSAVDTLNNVDKVTDGNGNTFLLVGDGGYATIQDAVNAASANQTILISPNNGAYQEQVTVSGLNGLTIEGVGSGVTVDAPSLLEQTGISPTSGHSIDGIFTVNNSTNVTIEDLTVDGLGNGANFDNSITVQTSPELVGISYLNSSGTINSDTVQNIRESLANIGVQRNVAIYVSNTGPTLNPITITHSTITSFQKGGVVATNADVNINNNVITGVGDVDTAQNGIQVSGSVGTVSDNTITDIGYSGTDAAATGVLAFDNNGLAITGNTFAGALDSEGNVLFSPVGFYVEDSTGGTVTGNTSDNVDDGIVVFDDITGTWLVSGNTASNLAAGGAGIYFEPQPTNASSSFTVNDSTDSSPDQLFLTPGTDALTGGNGGNNSFVVLEGSDLSAADTINGGGGGGNTIDFAPSAANDTLTIGSNVTNIQDINVVDQTALLTTGSLVFADTTAESVNALSASNGLTITGNNGGDTITGTAHFNDTLIGGTGNDTFNVGSGNDSINGGAGTDTVKYGASLTASDITVVNGQWQVTDGSHGTDTLNNVEEVTDGTHNFFLVGAGGFATIQDAINAASDGDTIMVAAGTYNESLNIDKGVTILGANADISGTGKRGAETIITGQSQITTSSQVIINGVEFLDQEAYTPSSTDSSDTFVALAVFDTSTTGDIVEDSVFNRDPSVDPNSSSTTFVGSGAQPTHRGIEISSVGAGTQVTIENNLFTGNNPYSYAGDDWRSAVYSNGGQGTTIIEDNTFENVRSAVNADTFSSTVHITGNVLDHDGSGVSIGVGSDVTNVTSIMDNTFGVNVDNEFNFSNLTTPVTFNAGATGNVLSAAAASDPTQYFYIEGGSADDNLTGTSGNDILLGDAGNNTLTGAGGNDVLYGNLTGVNTADYVSSLTASDITVVADADPFTAGNQPGWQVASGTAEGTDLLNSMQVVQGASSMSSTGRFLLVGDGGFTTTQAASGSANAGDTVLVQSGTDSSVQTIGVNNLTIDALSGSTSLNLLLGNGVTEITLADYASGTGAHVIVTGNNSSDTITGNDGNDTLTGGTGADTFNLGSGNNNVTGDGGIDTAHFASALTAASFSFSNDEWVVANGASTDDLSGISLVTDGAGHTFLLVGGGSQYSTISQASGSAQFAVGDVIVAPPPVVSATSLAVPATPQQVFPASSLFSATSQNGSAIVSYKVEDENIGAFNGFWTLNGLVEANGTAFTVTAAQLSGLNFTAGSNTTGITDTLEVAAADAGGLGAFTSFTVTAAPHAPEAAPTVTASNETVLPESTLAASSMFSGSASGGGTVIGYEVEDTTSNSGSWIFNGVAEPANQVIDVTAAQLSQLSFQTGFGTDTLMVRANDGTQWGNYATFTISPKANAAPPAGTTTVLDMEKPATGVYEYYDIGKNGILQAGPLDQISTSVSVVGIGGFNGSDTADLLARNTSTGAFTIYDVSNNNVIGSTPMGQVGLEWQVAGFGDFSGNSGETDMLMRNTSGQFEIYDIHNNGITGAASMGQVGTEWQVAGFGDFSTKAGETDMLMRNTNTGQFELYDISHNQIVSDASMGQVGLEWQVLGFGDFSGNANESDMLMQNENTGVFEVYDIRNNQIVSAASMGQVGLQWTVAGFADFSGNANETDLLMRNSGSGAFELYDISGNNVTAASSIGSVGTEWQVTGVAVDPPPGSSSATASTVLSGATDDPAGDNSISQLTQAMASIAAPGGMSTATSSLGQSPIPGADILATTTQNNPHV